VPTIPHFISNTLPGYQPLRISNPSFHLAKEY
jgi:hypothetical protein